VNNSNMIAHVAGCIGLLIVGAALAKDPAQTAESSLATPAPVGCTDSARGRTHVLRLCGDRHYWFKVRNAPTAPSVGSLSAGAGWGGGGPGTVGTVSVNMNR